MGIRLLTLGEIVGKPGIFTIKSGLEKLKQEHNIQGVIANGDGATHGYGLGRNHSIYLRKLGIDVITGGDQIYFKKDLHPHLEQASYILRPANFPPGNPGRGWRVYNFNGTKVGVINLLGLSGFNRVHPSNPFTFLPEITKRITDVSVLLVDFHSCTTAEKMAMALMSDGLVSAIVGTGMRAITSDAGLLPKGTAAISDLGRCGSIHSVGGFSPEKEIQQFVTAIPDRSHEWWMGLEIQGAVLEFDDQGKAVSIEPIRYPIASPSSDIQTHDDDD